MPPTSIKSNATLALQKLLSIPNMVFPLFSEIHAINDPVDGVVANVGVNALNQWV